MINNHASVPGYLRSPGRLWVASVLPGGITGRARLKHIIVYVAQENRSFDHYFGKTCTLAINLQRE